MADNGYSSGWYAWDRCTLKIFDKAPVEAQPLNKRGQLVPLAKYAIRLPSGISAEALLDKLGVIEPAGPARPLPPIPQAEPAQMLIAGCDRVQLVPERVT